jgi:hypothetical protein
VKCSPEADRFIIVGDPGPNTPPDGDCPLILHSNGGADFGGPSALHWADARPAWSWLLTAEVRPQPAATPICAITRDHFLV